MRYFLMLLGLLILAVMVIAGKRGDLSRKPPIYIFPDMDRQAKLRPQKDFGWFQDGRSSRLPVMGTIARGARYEVSPETTGRIPNTTNFVETIPVPVTEQLMARGRERFQIYCLPCHGGQGNGQGVVTKFGLTIIANLHDPRIVQMPDGEIFNTITYGKGQMGAYGAQVEIEDRWAVIAYLRALQRSQLGSIEDVPEPERAQFGK